MAGEVRTPQLTYPLAVALLLPLVTLLNAPSACRGRPLPTRGLFTAGGVNRWSRSRSPSRSTPSASTSPPATSASSQTRSAAGPCAPSSPPAPSPRWSGSAVRWRWLTRAVVGLIRRHRLAARTLPLAGVWPHGLATHVSATTPPATDFAQTTPHGTPPLSGLQLLLQLPARCASSAASRPLPPPADPRRGENVARRRGGGRRARLRRRLAARVAARRLPLRLAGTHRVSRRDGRSLAALCQPGAVGEGGAPVWGGAALGGPAQRGVRLWARAASVLVAGRG